MAISSKDIETLWGRYQSDGVSKGVSVSQYFEANGIPHHEMLTDGIATILRWLDIPRQVSKHTSPFIFRYFAIYVNILFLSKN